MNTKLVAGFGMMLGVAVAQSGLADPRGYFGVMDIESGPSSPVTNVLTALPDFMIGLRRGLLSAAFLSGADRSVGRPSAGDRPEVCPTFCGGVS